MESIRESQSGLLLWQPRMALDDVINTLRSRRTELLAEERLVIVNCDHCSASRDEVTKLSRLFPEFEVVSLREGQDRQDLEKKLSANVELFVTNDLKHVRTTLPKPTGQEHYVQLLPDLALLRQGYAQLESKPLTAWRTNAGYAITASDIIDLSYSAARQIKWLSHVDSDLHRGKVLARTRVSLSADSRIACLIPHFKCERYLERCLSSVVAQTRSPEAIVVIDDGSAIPPVDIVKQFPNVTLLASERQVGPYCVSQSFIDRTDFDAFLFQDADDWSAVDRLELLLEEAENSGCDLVGCQEFSIDEIQSTIRASSFPLDVNTFLISCSTHCLLHGSSLISRRLLSSLGGFATGLTYGADTELLFRSHWNFRVRNIPYYCYFRTIRRGSLTTSDATGLASAGRRALGARMME